MELSIETLKPLAEQFAQLCTQVLQAEPEQTIRQLETDMRKNLQLLGRLDLGQVLSQVEQVPEKRLLCSCGGELQSQRRRTAKNVIKLENYYSPGELERAIADWVHYYNHERYHEALENVTPADVFYGKEKEVLQKRNLLKEQTMALRRQNYLQTAGV